jgi:hypothetical protein
MSPTCYRVVGLDPENCHHASDMLGHHKGKDLSRTQAEPSQEEWDRVGILIHCMLQLLWAEPLGRDLSCHGTHTTSKTYHYLKFSNSTFY